MSHFNAGYDIINDHLITQLAGSDDLNYCRLILPEKEGIISVIGKYDPCYSPVLASDQPKTYFTLGEDLKPKECADLSRFYYGVSPVVDEQKIVNAIACGQFRNQTRLEEFIRTYHYAFMLHYDQKEYVLPCAKLFVLSIAHNFGIRIRIKDPQLLHTILDYSGSTLTAPGRTADEVLLCGCPTDEFFSRMLEYGFIRSAAGDYWDCVPLTNADCIPLEQVYRQPDNIILLKGHTFYSGTLLKVLEIKELEKNYGNDQVVPLCVHFERSSYATVFSFDNNFTDHPLLADCRDRLIEMYRQDDSYKRKLRDDTTAAQRSDPGCRAQYLNAINTYLSKSHNVNQLGVTGNILTTDHILLVGKRDQGSIDSGALYPSVNGNAEVIDSNVNFYKLSAHEDYPAIRIDAPRIDFNGELAREAYAELGIQLSSNWHCHGITLSGTVPPADSNGPYTVRHRRMHFNVICEQACEDSFTDILAKQKRATEAFESKTINGIKISYHKNVFAFLLSVMKNTISVLISNESYIMAFVALGALLSNILSNKVYTDAFHLSDLLSNIFTVLTIIAFAIMIFKHGREYRKKRSHVKNIRIIGTKKIFTRMNRYLCKYSSHPVTRAAIMCHITRAVLEKE